jgi:transcription antitermination factor NusG
VWSEGVSSQAGLERVVPPHFGVEPNLAADRWYALYVRSRHEKTVENSLRVKGYSVFSPFYRTKRKRVDRIAEIEVALFPGYVFCQFDTNKRLPILMTPGVVGVVGREIGQSPWMTRRSRPSELSRWLDVLFSRGPS